jgi:hypothetical protein
MGLAVAPCNRSAMDHVTMRQCSRIGIASSTYFSRRLLELACVPRPWPVVELPRLLLVSGGACLRAAPPSSRGARSCTQLPGQSRNLPPHRGARVTSPEPWTHRRHLEPTLLLSFPLATAMAATPFPLSVAVAGFVRLRPSLVLTVKFCQPSHEFTFGVGIIFIPYPLVLTPLV